MLNEATSDRQIVSTKINHAFSLPWIDVVTANSQALKRGLREEGYTPEMLTEITEAYNSVKSQADDLLEKGYFKDPDFYKETKDLDPIERHTKAYYKGGAEATRWAQFIKESFISFLKRLDHRVEEVFDIEIKLPLFKLHSPKIKGSEVIYEESTTEESQPSFSITVFGTGLGTTQAFSFMTSSTFKSTEGAYKLIYAPITVRSSLIGIYKNGVRMRHGLRTEMIVDKDQDFGIGIDTLTEEEYLQEIDRGKIRGKMFKLAGDRTDVIQSFKESWKLTSTYKYSAGLEAFNMKASFKAQIKQEKGVSLEFKLPAGHDYRLKKVLGGYGLVWDVR